MIRKIAIENYGSLVSFSNHESPFTKSDAIIHGINGSGKSQICNILSELSKLNKSKSFQTPQKQITEEKITLNLASRLSKEATSSIQKFCIDDYQLTIDTNTKKISESGKPIVIHVYNEEYVNDNVSDIVNLPALEIRIGKKNIERDFVVKEIRESGIALRRIEEEIVKKIESTKACTGYEGQVRTDKLITKENYLQKLNPGESYPEAKSLIDKLDNPPDKITSHLSFILPNIKFDETVRKKILEIFDNKYLEPNLTQDIYKKYVSTHKVFYEDGLSLYKEIINQCPFCLSRKESSDNILKELAKYLESDYNSSYETLIKFYNRLIDNKKDVETFIENWNRHIDVINQKSKQLAINKNISKISFNDILFNSIVEQIEIKKNEMNKNKIDLNFDKSVFDLYDSFVNNLSTVYNEHVAFINQINTEIESISSKKRELGDKIIKHHMFSLWNDSSLRDRYYELQTKLNNSKGRFRNINQTSSNDQTIEFFNQIVKILGIHKYELNEKSNIVLKLTNVHDISKEGFRISTGERKFIALAYFFAEVLASVNSSSELEDVTVVIDDPVDSSDYQKFYSFISLIENLEKILRNIYGNAELKLGQFLIFTHNALLFERLVNSNGNRDIFILMLKDHKTLIERQTQKISLITFSSYLTKITDYIKNMEGLKNPEIGNYIRRVLEIVSSFENIDTNKLSDLNKSPKLNTLAHHLSHESIERMLDPLPESHEYIEACIELMEEIEMRVPYLYKTIKEKYLEKEIGEYRKQYNELFLKN